MNKKEYRVKYVCNYDGLMPDSIKYIIIHSTDIFLALREAEIELDITHYDCAIEIVAIEKL